MRTLFVSGSDTNVGKTWVVGAIARHLSSRGDSVQIVKPIESGVTDESQSDVAQVLAHCASPLVTGYTLRSFALPIAPVAAAEHEGTTLEFSEIETSVGKLPKGVDWRIVEGAGSIATPVCYDGRDWLDVALAVGSDALVLVVEDRVGAIGQARLVYEYVAAKGLNCGIWLNEMNTQDSQGKQGTLNGVRNLGIPIWGFSEVGRVGGRLAVEAWL